MTESVFELGLSLSIWPSCVHSCGFNFRALLVAFLSADRRRKREMGNFPSPSSILIAPQRGPISTTLSVVFFVFVFVFESGSEGVEEEGERGRRQDQKLPFDPLRRI